MCLLVLAWRAHPRYRLIVAANRDEFHERPAAALAVWPQPALLAGRDLRARGTWLAVGRDRRFGVVTNFREGRPPRPDAPSRGQLIPQYLAAESDPQQYFAELAPRASQYSGFNLLLSDADSLWYGSNRATPFARPLAAGVHGLANELLDSPWPKLQRVRRGFEDWVAPGTGTVEQLFALLADRTPAQAAGDGARDPAERAWQQALSAPFVRHPRYGTRCSSVLMQRQDGALTFIERRFDAGGEPSGETAIELAAGEWPRSQSAGQPDPAVL